MQAMLRKRRIAWDYSGLFDRTIRLGESWVWDGLGFEKQLLTTRVIIEAGQRMCKIRDRVFTPPGIHSCIVEENHGLLAVLMSGKYRQYRDIDSLTVKSVATHSF